MLISTLVFAVFCGSAEAQTPKQKGGKLGDILAKQATERGRRRMRRKRYFSHIRRDKTRKTLKTIPPATLGSPLTVEKLNAVLAADLVKLGETADGEPISDDQFIRRVYLDLIGQLPSPTDIKEFVAEPSPTKRAKTGRPTPAPCRSSAKTGADTGTTRSATATPRAGTAKAPFEFQPWMAEQFNRNLGWDKIVTAILTANGKSEDTPQGLLLAAHEMMPAEMAGETARLFMGLRILRQCHDHRADHWKRDQFHELAAFFGKVAVRRTQADMFRSAEIRRNDSAASTANRISKTRPIPARYLADLSHRPTGAQPSGRPRTPNGLAEFVTTPKNPLFAKAFVNRVWASFVGSPFTDAVDDVGEQNAAVAAENLRALAKSFARRSSTSSA